ncbi:energy-coupling factor transporter transmembrane protein EcfT [Coprothermobacteraceae bacterium]|nr:energy-coupling factor transporter transmembrane protein EcfT [Coprothermobacteraceae bacterium]
MALRDTVLIGQFVPASSALHRTRAETKILMTLGLIVSAFLSKSFAVQSFLYFVLIILLLLSQVPLRFYAKSARAVLWLVLITFVFNALLTGSHVLWQIGWLAFKLEGVVQGAFFGLRLFFVIFASTVLTVTTSPVDLADGLNNLLRPLQRVRVPVEEFSLIMTIALRFIPVLADEADRIVKAQKARGLTLSGGVMQRIEKLIPIVVPLFVSAFMKAEDLALAMEVRGYVPGVRRSKYKVTRFGVRDIGFAFMTLLVVVVSVALREVWTFSL